MNQLASRRAFLRGKVLRAEVSAIRPPGTVEDAFYELCVQCDDCVQACPENIISFDAQGWPVVQLDAGPCTFCGDCAAACKTGALVPDNTNNWPWRADVATHCLSLNGISCRICQDNCDLDAIRFKLQLGGRSEPIIDTEACSGCGACAGSCPAGAVTFSRHTLNTPEATQ